MASFMGMYGPVSDGMGQAMGSSIDEIMIDHVCLYPNSNPNPAYLRAPYYTRTCERP